MIDLDEITRLEREQYVATRILSAEAAGKVWAEIQWKVHRDAAIVMAHRGVVQCVEDGRRFLVRRANGVRIEGVA